ncbi:MAG TPA: porin [Gammaproteobacteria bacterium]|nr:porin [Gammaproteobacteria bacterium]
MARHLDRRGAHLVRAARLERLPYVRVALWFALLAAAVFVVRGARAEPYIAVATGFKCVQCHTNPDGGGKRKPFGIAYAQAELAQRVVAKGGADQWTGDVNRFLAIGGDLRSGLDYTDIGGSTPGADETSDFGVSRAGVYLELRAIPDLLTFYVDEQLAPGSTLNREAYALLTAANGKYTVKAGKFFLPFGWRLQDDSAFVRAVTGVNFNTPDNGVELGLELPKWSAQVAVTNGTAGAPDVDTGKQLSLSASYVKSRWRVGASANTNNAELGDRDMYGVFAGVRTGPVSWLTELDRVTDKTPLGDVDQDVTLLEADWRIAKGHNLKITYEWHDPTGASDDELERYSLVWEYSPMQLMQARIGWRAYDGVPSVPATNRDEVFAELHVYF